MGILKNLRFWRRRRDVGAVYQERIDELQSKQEEKDAIQEQLEATLHGHITQLEEELFKRNLERDQLQQELEDREQESKQREAILHHRATSLQKKLEKLRISRMEMWNKLYRLITSLEKKLQEKECEVLQTEVTLRGEISTLEKRLKEKEREKELTEATLRGQITLLEKKIEDKDREREQTEATLHSQITRLQKKLEERERESGRVKTTHRGKIREWLHGWKTGSKKLGKKDREREETEATLQRQREELERRMEKRENHAKEMETILHGEIKKLDKELQQQIGIDKEEKRDWKKVERAPHDQSKQRNRRISDGQKLEYTIACQNNEQDTHQHTSKDVRVEETQHGQMEDHQDEDCSPKEVERRSDERGSQSKDVETMEISETDQDKENVKDTLPSPMNEQEEPPQEGAQKTTDNDEHYKEIQLEQDEDLEDEDCTVVQVRRWIRHRHQGKRGTTWDI